MRITLILLTAWAANIGFSQEEKKPRPLNVGGLDSGGGTITGVVKFKGKQPPRGPIGIAGNAFCAACWAGKPEPRKEEWIFGKNGDDATLQNVLVHVTKGLGEKPFAPPKERVVIDQVKCIYVPRVVGIMVGQTLEVRSSDATLHNVNCQPLNNKFFNQASNKGDLVTNVFTQRELRVMLQCNMHQWMKAWVHVLEHPFYAVTQEDGTFTIRGLPPGEYEVSVLHEASRFAAEPASRTVRVAEGEKSTLEFAFQDKQE